MNNKTKGELLKELNDSAYAMFPTTDDYEPKLDMVDSSTARFPPEMALPTCALPSGLFIQNMDKETTAEGEYDHAKKDDFCDPLVEFVLRATRPNLEERIKSLSAEQEVVGSDFGNRLQDAFSALRMLHAGPGAPTTKSHEELLLAKYKDSLLLLEGARKSCRDESARGQMDTAIHILKTAHIIAITPEDTGLEEATRRSQARG